MKFRADHVIAGISRESYGELYFEDAFNVALCVAVKLGREPLEFTRTGSRVFRRVRVEVLDRAIPGPVASVVGTDRFSYVEELDMDLASGSGTWRTIPTVFADKVDARGTLRFLDEGGSARRVVEGEIDVSLFGIGGIVERFICSDAEKSYAAAAEFTRRYLAERR